MPLSFTHRSRPQKVCFGAGGARDHLAAEVARLGATRILLIATGSAHESATALTAGLPLVARTDGVIQHVPAEEVEATRLTAARCGADLLVSIGGGSAVGLAKAVAVADGLPVIAVPTTYSGSEATSVWGMTVAGFKEVRLSDRALPTTVIYDPDLLATLPTELAGLSALNAVAHCVDTMWANSVSPISQALAMEGLQALARGVPLLASGESRGSELGLYGGYLAATAYAGVGKALHHEIVHVLGGMCGLPHARTHALILPYVAAVNTPADPGAARRIARALGAGPDQVDRNPAAATVEHLLALREPLSGPWSLAELGVSGEHLDVLVPAIQAEVPAANPRPVTPELLQLILQAARSGADPRGLLPRGTYPGAKVHRGDR